MILTEDRHWNYARQLTEFLPRVENLQFALNPFVNDSKVHCVVRKTKNGEYAVFVKPQFINETDRNMVATERYHLEEKLECRVVDPLHE